MNEESIKVPLLGTLQECERLPLAKSLEWVTVYSPQFRSCVKVEVAVLDSLSLIVLTVSVDVTEATLNSNPVNADLNKILAQSKGDNQSCAQQRN